MPTTILQAPTHGPPSDALKTSQLAPVVLATTLYTSSSGPSLPWPLSKVFPPTETPETWTTYENLFLSTLRTGDDAAARKCLERLIARFGDKNERVMALKGLYEEAVAQDNKALEEVLKSYDAILAEDAANMPIRKRRIALLSSLSRPQEAITALTELLTASPTDAEAWAELSALYFKQNLLSQAIHCIEEVLVITPNAWNMHARLGELLYLSSLSNPSDSQRPLAEAIRRYSRSIELCDDYLRGYFGLKLTTKKLLEGTPKSSKSKEVSDPTVEDLPPPSIQSVQKLHELATKKLGEIVRKAASKAPGWEGYNPGEVIAARELLDQDTQKIAR